MAWRKGKVFKKKHAAKYRKKIGKRTKKYSIKRKYVKVSNKSLVSHQLPPVQFGTGHWKARGHGPKGSFKLQGTLNKLEKLLPLNRQALNSSIQISTTAGQQQYAIVGSLYTPYDLDNYNGPSKAVIGGTAPIAANKSILKDYSMSIMFTNQANSNVQVKFYDFICRRDIYVSNTAAAEYMYNPSNAWTNETVTEYGTAYSPYDIGATPFDSSSLCQYFKCIGSKEFRLSEGETGEYVMTGKMNKKFDFNTLIGIAPSGTPTLVDVGGLKGLTSYTLAVVTGPATDANNTVVTTGLACVDFVTVKKYNFQQLSLYASTNTYTNALGTVAGQEVCQGSGALGAIAKI